MYQCLDDQLRGGAYETPEKRLRSANQTLWGENKGDGEHPLKCTAHFNPDKHFVTISI